MTALSIGGTQTGGTSKTLTPGGVENGRYRFVFPEHTALAGREMLLSVKKSPVTKDSLGAQEALVDFALTNIEPAEGCCTVQQGGVYVNLKVRWSLNQDSTLVDTALDYLQGIAFSTILDDMIKKGIISA